MDQRRRKRKNSELEYLKNVFNGVLHILKSHPPEKFPNDAFTIKHIVNTHKLCVTQTDLCELRETLSTPNLSFRKYEKLISLIAKEVKTRIETDLLLHADIFSISIDFLPDTDESAIFIRYINDDGIPVKRFLDIINKKADNTLQIMDILHMIFDKYNLNRNGFMGLSYDIDSNLPAQISDLKSSLKAINKFAKIMPCSSDSIRSVLIKALSTVYEGNALITMIDELFNFLMIFKHKQWQIQYLFKNLVNIKHATNSCIQRYLFSNWSEVVNALLQISENICFPENLRIQAFALLVKIKRSDICILAIFWIEYMELTIELEDRLKLFVSNEIDFFKILEIYEMFLEFLSEFRTDVKFMDLKTRAIERSNILHFYDRNYTEESQVRFPVSYTDDADKFKLNTYFPIIDKIQSELSNRKMMYEDLAFKFNFLNKIPEITDSELNQKHENLQQIYDELTFHIDTECKDLKKLFRKYLSTHENHPTSIIGISTFIRLNRYKEHFSQLLKVIKMALCIPAINCPDQQSSSVLKKIKTPLQLIANEDTYKSLLLINVEWHFFKTLNFDSVIQDYALHCLRK